MPLAWIVDPLNMSLLTSFEFAICYGATFKIKHPELQVLLDILYTVHGKLNTANCTLHTIHHTWIKLGMVQKL